MKIDKLNFLLNSKLKKYLLYALGEIILIVSGILIAMKVDNYNATKNYEKTMDQNFIKVAKELKNNIENAQIGINFIRQTDSLIRIISTQSLTIEDYKKNKDYAGITRQHMTSMIGTFDYNNLLNYNISNKQYKSELISKIRTAYGYKDFILENENTIKKFVNEKSIPFFSTNTDFIYFGKQNDELFKFLISSKEYKSLFNQYAEMNFTLDVSYQFFYLSAIAAYEELAKHYKIEPLQLYNHKDFKKEYFGTYFSEKLGDTAKIFEEKDSIYIMVQHRKNKLIGLDKNKFLFKANEGLFPFIIFSNDSVFHVESKSRDFEFIKIRK